MSFLSARKIWVGVLAGIAVLGFLWLGRGLPHIPWAASDSESYLHFSAVRPHGYPLFLAGYRLIFDDLAYLPSVQLGFYIGAVLLLAIALARRTRSFAAAVATLVLVFAGADTTSFPYVLSDPLYAAALTAGIAGFILYVDVPRPGFLLLASAAIGIALMFRAIGVVLLPGFFLAVVLDFIIRRAAIGRAAALSALPIALLWLTGASSQLVHNGRFVLGNWGGIDVLGKLALLSHPVPGESGRLNGLAESMEPAREKLRNLDPFVEALAARQYYDYLRWFVIVPELERSWQDWRDGDDYRRGQLAAELATPYIARDPLGFTRRSAIDLLGLWAMPRWLTRRERESALSEINAVGDLPGLSTFALTPEGKLDYYKIVPDPSDPAKVVIFRLIVVSFWGVSLVVFALVLLTRARAAVMAPDLVLIVVMVHTFYLGTALMEGTYARYIMPSWPALVAGSILAVGLFRRRLSQPATAMQSSPAR